MHLTGPWRAAEANDELRRQFALTDHDDSSWPVVAVPGHWRSEPSFAESDGPLLYRTRFATTATSDDRRTWLAFDGIFNQGDVWLDGAYLGVTDGYFQPHRFEITDAVADRSEHLLAVEVGSSLPSDRDHKRVLTGAFSHGAFVDRQWNPGGIWQPAHVVETGPVAIRHFRLLCVAATEARARLKVRLVIDSPGAQLLRFRTRVAGVEHVHDQAAAAGENRVEWFVEVDNPALWWPHALGPQPLFDAEVEVLTESGEITDRRRCRTGFRTVTMNDWHTTINGERMFLKGAALAPVQRALGDVSHDRVTELLHQARQAGLDLVRVHTHVSVPDLYDRADELGLLVWQDLPLHKGYARSVKDAAIEQARWAVDLLGHHPSVAVWCAHDEPQGTDAIRPRPAAESLLGHQVPSWNRSVLDRALKREITKSDGTRPVVAHSGVLAHFPQLDGTDTHLWFGWREGRAADLADHAASLPRQVRFVSAFGAQSVPDDNSFARPERWPRLDWVELAEHFALDVLPLLTRFPPDRYDSFDAWRRATQSHQAHVIKTTIEILRRLKYQPTGGFVQFALNDAQPAIGFSVIDHNGTPKPAYEALVAACRPVIVVADPFPSNLTAGTTVELDIHVVSDLRQPIEQVTLDAILTDPSGRHVFSWGGDIPADSCIRVGTIEWPVPVSWGEVALELQLTGPGLDVTNRTTTQLPSFAL